MHKRRRSRGGVALAVLLAAPVALLPAMGTVYAQEMVEEDVVVPTMSEGWYDVSPAATAPPDPTCAPVPLCPPPVADPTAASAPGSLHVAATLGRSRAITTFDLDLTALPLDAELVAGTAILPLAGADSGTEAPDSADMLACLLVEEARFADGASAEEAPRYDCSTSTAVLLDGTGSERPYFAFDLQPFIEAWTDGAAMLGLAVIPNPTQSNPLASWHVAVPPQDGANPESGIHAQLVVRTASSDIPVGGEVAPPAEPEVLDPIVEVPSGDAPLPSFDPVPFDLPPPVAGPEAAPVPADDSPAAAPIEEVPIARTLRMGRLFRNPVVWLLPLLGLVLVHLLSQSLAQPIRSSSGPLARDLLLQPKERT